jgi:3-oxoacyl-[acyl-carrier protein] reductase
MTPQQVAQALMIGLQKDTSEILVGWQSHLAVWSQNFAPWLLEVVLKLAAPRKQPQISLIKSLTAKIQHFSNWLFSKNKVAFVSERK